MVPKNRPCPIRMRTQVPKFAQQPDPKCGHTGPSVARSDPDADIFGDLLTKFLTQTKDEFFFVECASVVNHHFIITGCYHRSTFYQN